MSNEVKRRFEEWCGKSIRYNAERASNYIEIYDQPFQKFLDSFDNMKLVPEEEKRTFPEFDEQSCVISGMQFNDLKWQVERLQHAAAKFEILEKRLAALEADVKALNNIVNEMSETEEIKKRI